MTVSYNLDMSTSTSGSFLRILFRWRGSVWKSVLNELIVWTAMFYTVFAIYRFVLSEDDQKAFESVAKHVNEKMDLLPLHFILGFFVTIIVDRWKQIFQNIGFVDSAAYFICTYIRGTDHEIRMARRNCIRYLCLTQVLVLRDISIQVRKRFPNLDSLIDSGLMKQNEREMMDKVRNGFSKYWMPIHWTFTICHEMRIKGNIAADVLLNSLLQEIKLFREKLQTLCNYDWVPVPLAYPQVVFLAVRIYFLLCLFCRQYRWHENADTQNQVDRVLPIMTMLQFFFIMGWLKVAEALLNPLGEDDDDYEFECNYIIDRNIAIAMTMVDECFDQKPEQMPGDSPDDDGDAKELLAYSESAASQPQHPLVGSATMSNLPQEKQHIRMVHRQPSQMDGNELNENMASACPSTNALPRRSTNVLLRRMSTISLGKLRAIRQSISLPIRGGEKEKNGGGKVGGIEKNGTAIKGWSMDFDDGKSIVEMEANGQQKFSVNGKELNLHGIPTIATAPELRRQHSLSSPSMEVRSLQLHHLEPLSEEKDILPDEFIEIAGINLPTSTELNSSSQKNGK